MATVHGSWPHISPWGAAAWFSAWRVTPAPTSAMRSAGRTWISWSPRRSSTTPGTSDAAPPISPLPPPMGITGTPCIDARRTTTATSAVCSGRTTHNGSATVQPGRRPGWSASRAKTLSVLWSVYTLLTVTASWRACSSAFSDIDTSILRRHDLKVVVRLQDSNEAHRKRQIGNTNSRRLNVLPSFADTRTVWLTPAETRSEAEGEVEKVHAWLFPLYGTECSEVR